MWYSRYKPICSCLILYVRLTSMTVNSCTNTPSVSKAESVWWKILPSFMIIIPNKICMFKVIIEALTHAFFLNDYISEMCENKHGLIGI